MFVFATMASSTHTKIVLTIKETILHFKTSRMTQAKKKQHCWKVQKCSKRFDKGTSQKWRRRGKREGYPKLVAKNGIWGRGLHVNSYITTKENYVLSFYFLLVFSQRGSSWVFVNIRVVVSLQALAWVRVPRLNKA